MQELFGSVEYSFEIFGDFKMKVANAVWKIFSGNVQLLGCRDRGGGDLSLWGLGLCQRNMAEGESNLNEGWWYLITFITSRSWFSIFLGYGSRRNSVENYGSSLLKNAGLLTLIHTHTIDPRTWTPTLGDHQINSPIPQYQQLLYQRLPTNFRNLYF